MIDRRRILATVARIPAGRVATYGQIAALAGYPRAARQVGYALAALDTDSDIPWHRVINARGSISPRADPGQADWQRIRLEAEGLVFDDAGRLDLRRWGWHPEDSADSI